MSPSICLEIHPKQFEKRENNLHKPTEKKNSVTVRCHLNDPLARWITRLRLYPFFETKNLIFQEQQTYCVDHWDIYRVTRQAGVPILGHETLF